MPFERFRQPPLRIAVVGGGITGLSSALALSASHAVTLYESAPRLGGHARTLIAGKRGDQPVDTGFIVFNHVNYPHLTRLFDRLQVPTAPSSMTFGASTLGGRLEFALKTLDKVFAQRWRIADPRYLRMIGDILRFNTRAETLVTPGMTIAGLLDALGTGPWFRDHYITPFSGAIWSTPTQGILEFPAHALVSFFRNHGLFGRRHQHQWHTVRGGSVEYVTRLTAVLARQGVDLRPSAPVSAIRRSAGGVILHSPGAEPEFFDQVVMATHADVSLSLLADVTPAERAALGAFRFQPNEAVLHADPRLMPKRRKVWSSWNYVEPDGHRPDRISLTYWMNELQPIPQDDPLFVTLNATSGLRDELVHDVTTFRHPMYDLAALQAQRDIAAMNGTGNTWFCGAWMRNGFHEDGIAIATETAQALMARAAEREAA
ncbi:MAG: FAD-dependent oxidoreductase [Fuscovulum sp.]|nr:FAD-dependent oxidoreductase [Fuscovulum sp.]